MRDQHPTDSAWRADALAKSRHSRLLDELRVPLEDHDRERAERVCAEVARSSLRDLAPALILLPRRERRRAQALAAYALMLFDFAEQGGLEGERLAQLNRLQFNAELALSGEPPGQPVFVLLAREEQRRPWPRQALERIAGAARRRVARPRPRSTTEAEAEAAELGAALSECLSGLEPTPELARFATSLLRLRDLQSLAEDLRRNRPRIPVSRLPEEIVLGGGEANAERLGEAVLEECRELRRQLEPVPAAATPAPFRRAARYLALAAVGLLDRIERLGADAARHSPRLGAGTRIAYLLRARF